MMKISYFDNKKYKKYIEINEFFNFNFLMQWYSIE